MYVSSLYIIISYFYSVIRCTNKHHWGTTSLQLRKIPGAFTCTYVSHKTNDIVWWVSSHRGKTQRIWWVQAYYDGNVPQRYPASNPSHWCAISKLLGNRCWHAWSCWFRVWNDLDEQSSSVLAVFNLSEKNMLVIGAIGDHHPRYGITHGWNRQPAIDAVVWFVALETWHKPILEPPSQG